MNSKGFNWTGWVKSFNIDNSVTNVYIATLKGWKCIRKNCKADYKHSHTTYKCLK